MIEFRPLLTDGGLSAIPGGFNIFVGCEAESQKEFNERFMENGTGASLPVRIANRARFTIAHEIAHTFLYNLNSSPPIPSIKISNVADIRELESSCNTCAANLLLPTLALIRRFPDPGQLLDIANLKNLISDAFISRPNLVLRLGQLRAEHMPIGIIANIVLTEGRWQLKALARHYSLRTVASGAKPQADAKELLGVRSDLLNSTAATEFTMEMAGREFLCCIESTNPHQTYQSRLVVLRRLL